MCRGVHLRLRARPPPCSDRTVWAPRTSTRPMSTQDAHRLRGTLPPTRPTNPPLIETCVQEAFSQGVLRTAPCACLQDPFQNSVTDRPGRLWWHRGGRGMWWHRVAERRGDAGEDRRCGQRPGARPLWRVHRIIDGPGSPRPSLRFSVRWERLTGGAQPVSRSVCVLGYPITASNDVDSKH